MGYHVLTHVSGAILAVMLVIIIGFTVLAVRGLVAHRATEAASNAARGSQTTVWALGMSLPTLLRASAVACCVSSIHCAIQALVANWLVLDPVRDYGLRFVSPVRPASDYDFSSAAQLCIATAKLGPPIYVVTKAFSYLFFFLKSRTVRPTEKMSWLHKGVLLVTLQMYSFAACGLWLVTGDWVKLDATCSFWVPPWMIILMGCADVVLSSMYCVLFIAPLRETIQANRAMRSGAARGGRVKVTPADSAVVTAASAADAGGQALAAASARGSALEVVMRRNLQSCVLSILCTAAAMSFIMAAHLLDQQEMRKVSWVVGTVDLAITCLSIEHLMRSHKSGAPSSNASTAGTNGTAQRGGTGAPPTVVGASKAHSSNHGGAVTSALGRLPGGLAPDNAVTQQLPLQTREPSTAISDPAAVQVRGSASPPTASSSLGLGLVLASAVGPQPESRDAPTPMHNRYMVSTPSPEPTTPPPRRDDVVLEMQSLPPRIDPLPRASLQ